jgi:hypothetical protein
MYATAEYKIKGHSIINRLECVEAITSSVKR